MPCYKTLLSLIYTHTFLIPLVIKERVHFLLPKSAALFVRPYFLLQTFIQWGKRTQKTSLNTWERASLVAQWLRIHLPMQGTWVRALAQEDPTCRGATKPVRHNYWGCALEPVSHNYWARVPRARAPQQRKATTMRSPCTATKRTPGSPHLEKACKQQRRPNAAKINK